MSRHPAYALEIDWPDSQSPPRVFLINRYFYPDRSATSQLLADMAFYLADKGRDVHVIAGAGSYDDPTLTFPAFDQVGGVQVHRVAVGRQRRHSLAGRALSYISLYLALAFEAFRRTRAGDIVVVKTDPPLLSIALAPVAKLKRLKQVNWLQDLYPEVAAKLGVAGFKGPIGRALAIARNASLRSAAMNIAIGENMRSRLGELNVPAEKTAVITNWCDERAISPQPREGNALRNAWGLADKFVIGYSGNLGRAHEYRTLLGAAIALRNEPDMVFLFIGGGHFMDDLRREVSALGLASQFQFRPYQDASLLAQSLSVPDVHWLSLIPELEGLIVPSKFYGIAAAARPMIAVMDVNGEIARLVRQFDCGAVIAPNDSAGFARTARDWRSQPAMLAAMGRNARNMLDREFRKQNSLEKWDRVLTAICQKAAVIAPMEEASA